MSLIILSYVCFLSTTILICYHKKLQILVSKVLKTGELGIGQDLRREDTRKQIYTKESERLFVGFKFEEWDSWWSTQKSGKIGF